jgi:hypothetical protein
MMIELDKEQEARLHEALRDGDDYVELFGGKLHYRSFNKPALRIILHF